MASPSQTIVIINGVNSKQCSRCKLIKPVETFTADKRRSSGFQAECRECYRVRASRRWVEKPDHMRKMKRAEYQRNKDWYSEYQKKYNAENSELVAARHREYRQKPEPKEAHRIASRKYRESNTELCNERIKRSQTKNPMPGKNSRHKRRAVMYGVDAENIKLEIIAERDGWVCGICNKPINPETKWPDQQCWSIDHVEPLSMGGAHTHDNVRLTHWICNVRRGAARERTRKDRI